MQRLQFEMFPYWDKVGGSKGIAAVQHLLWLSIVVVSAITTPDNALFIGDSYHLMNWLEFHQPRSLWEIYVRYTPTPNVFSSNLASDIYKISITNRLLLNETTFYKRHTWNEKFFSNMSLISLYGFRRRCLLKLLAISFIIFLFVNV